MCDDRAFWHKFLYYENQNKADNQGHSLSYKVNGATEAYYTRVGMHCSHSDKEEGEGKYPGAKVVPEIACQFFTSNFKI
jgi:hypothetical protein